MRRSIHLALVSAALWGGLGTPLVLAADPEGAQAFLKKEKCAACHALDKKKDGPALKDIAARNKGKADAEAALVRHILNGATVEIDGVKEAHPKPKSNDQAQIKNVVQYILSL